MKIAIGLCLLVFPLIVAFTLRKIKKRNEIDPVVKLFALISISLSLEGIAMCLIFGVYLIVEAFLK